MFIQIKSDADKIKKEEIFFSGIINKDEDNWRRIHKVYDEVFNAQFVLDENYNTIRIR